jgi:hypothetical protein
MENLISSPSITFEYNKKSNLYSCSIVRISTKYNEVAGSGFLAYYQENGSSEEGLYAVCTAFHVLNTNDIENISKFVISFQGNIKLGSVNISKNFVKFIWSDSQIDAIAIVLNTYVAAHWMRLGARFLEISIPFVGMSVGIPEISYYSDFQIRGIKTGTIVGLAETSILYHNCITSSGSSGSPLINLEGCAVGLHIGIGGRGIMNEKKAIILESLLISWISAKSESQLILLHSFTDDEIDDESNNLQFYKNEETKKIKSGINPLDPIHPIEPIEPIYRENNIHALIK